MKDENVLKVLAEALEMEKKGHAFYKEGALRINNSLGRRMLTRLAEDELLHMKRIREIYDSISLGSTAEIKPPEFQTEKFETIFKRMKEQMEEAVEDLSEVGVDDDEIIYVALELESHAKFYYSEAAEKTDDERVRKFYEMLAVEENQHYDLLVNTKKYMENPSLFFGMGYH